MSIKWTKFNFNDESTFPAPERNILIAGAVGTDGTYKIVFSGKLNNDRQFIAYDLKFVGFLSGLEAWTYYPTYPTKKELDTKEDKLTKELHVHFSKDEEECLLVTDMFSTRSAIDTKKSIIHTTCSHFTHPRYWVNTYRLFIHPSVGDVFEITLGNKNTHTNRTLREDNNIEQMLLSGEFDKDDTICF